jgi:hypothetical protein
MESQDTKQALQSQMEMLTMLAIAHSNATVARSADRAPHPIDHDAEKRKRDAERKEKRRRKISNKTRKGNRG